MTGCTTTVLSTRLSHWQGCRSGCAAPDGGEQAVLASYLMGSPGFAVSGAGSVPTVEPFGLLAALPEDVVAAARRWRDHIVEVETGLPPDAAAGAAPRPEYDAARTTLVQREQAKAAELGVGFRTVERHRARYDSQGLWGLVDQRAVRTWDAAGRADARLVEMVREVIAAETDVSTGTRARLIRRVIKRVEQIHGPGVVPLPGQTAFTH